ncbi:hypothetical protein KW807_01595 [Candidatus Parcubacteria bacterium]|nr:hypothetical protein [Candidatus Parcubacteria bacterium]
MFVGTVLGFMAYSKGNGPGLMACVGQLVAFALMVRYLNPGIQFDGVWQRLLLSVFAAGILFGAAVVHVKSVTPNGHHP